MEKKKPGTVTVPKENVKKLLGKAKDGIVKAMDQNGDGTFDMKDVSVIAGSIGNAAKDTISAMKESTEERGRIAERKALCPIFADDLDSADFALTKLIRITDIDKKRAESEVCRDSIGYVSAQKDLRIVNIYRKSAEMFGLSFYPDMDREIYYVDPTDRNSYIALEEYFNYLKLVRVGELQKTAQDLGAKYFKVTLKENNMSHSKKETKAKEKAKIVSVKESAEGKMDVTTSDASSLEVAAEMQCVGHPPKAPVLNYLRKDPAIQSLIALRMDQASPHHLKYTLKLSNSSGIKEKDAVKIDAALKALKIAGSASLVSEARSESRRFFEYEIDF